MVISQLKSQPKSPNNFVNLHYLLRRFPSRFSAIVFVVLTLFPWRPLIAADAPQIVAAENFYGSVVQQIAPHASVTSILSNPNQDPHEFQTDATTATAVAQATL